MAYVRRSRKLWKLMPVARAIAVLSAVGVITAAVTFSALQSSGNALTGNSIETATPKLQLSTDGSSFSDSVPGFDFKGIIPGGTPQPTVNGGYLVAVRNVGDSDLRLSVSVPTPPNVTGVTDLSKVELVLTPPAGNGTYPPQIMKLSSLLAGQVSIVNQGTLIKTATMSYHLQVSMDSDAVSGSSATISGLDIVFSGTPQ